MTTFKQFLAEAEEGNLQQMLDLYNSDFSDFPLSHPMGRVEMRPIKKMQVLQPRAEPRKMSTGGSHHLQRALKRQPSWKDVPDRDYSIFATTAPGQGTFATMNPDKDLSHLAIIPRDGAVIAMIEDDFNLKKVTFAGQTMRMWEVFNVRKITHLEGFKRDIMDTQVRLRAPVATDVFSFKKLYDYIYEHVDDSVRGDLEHVFAPTLEFIEMVKADKLPPEFFGITLTTSNDYRKPSKPHEAWFHADALAIPIKQYEKFHQLVSNQ